MQKIYISNGGICNGAKSLDLKRKRIPIPYRVVGFIETYRIMPPQGENPQIPRGPKFHITVIVGYIKWYVYLLVELV